MNLQKIKTGNDIPNSVNVVIEIAMDSVNPIKYEIDKESSAIFVDRFIATSMRYPCNYGFIPHTLSEDGDPIDVLVISDFPVMPGVVIESKPIGVLMMEDEKGKDEKIIAVPVAKLNSMFSEYNSIDDVSKSLLNKITHFFERYKDLEKGKWVKIEGFKDAKKARELIIDAVSRHDKELAIDHLQDQSV